MWLTRLRCKLKMDPFIKHYWYPNLTELLLKTKVELKYLQVLLSGRECILGAARVRHGCRALSRPQYLISIRISSHYDCFYK